MQPIIIIVETAAGRTCCEAGGIPKGLFVVARSQWRSLVSAIESWPGDVILERECAESGGGHGCILHDNLKEIVAGCVIRAEDPSDELVDFVGRAGDRTMLRVLRAWVREQAASD